jgi:hypothetical protein
MEVITFLPPMTGYNFAEAANRCVLTVYFREVEATTARAALAEAKAIATDEVRAGRLPEPWHVDARPVA